MQLDIDEINKALREDYMLRLGVSKEEISFYNIIEEMKIHFTKKAASEIGKVMKNYSEQCTRAILECYKTYFKKDIKSDVLQPLFDLPSAETINNKEDQ